jgi:osmotically inducible protein OsmC
MSPAEFPALELSAIRRFVEALLALSDNPQPENGAVPGCEPWARGLPLEKKAAPEARGLTKRTDMNDGLQNLYTAEAPAVGGREGNARTNDGRVDVALDIPRELGGSGGPGTNPEQLFATGYAACFQSALLRIAAARKLDLSGSRITARVGIGTVKSGGFGLAAALDLDAPQLSREQGLDLMTRAHEDCPSSRATRGNIEVTLSLGGLPADENRAAA